MAERKIRIFDYQDFREFLVAWYENEKKANTKFSHRYIAEKVGATSSGWFSDIVKGRITFTAPYFSKLFRLMNLTSNESDYFEVLVGFQQAKSHDDKMRFFDKIIGFREVKLDLLGKEKFEFYRHWFYSAIRELLFYHDFNGKNYRALGKMLKPSITQAQAKSAVQTLEKLELIKKDSNGYYRPTSMNIKKDSEFRTALLTLFHRKSLELASEALNEFSKEERDISSLTMGLTPQAYKKATQEIEALRKKLLRLEKTGSGPRKVYQCNFQVFPLTEEISRD